MSRRSPILTGELGAVASTYDADTNKLDLGDDASVHRLRVLARSSEAGGKFGYLVVSSSVIADPAVPLAAAAQRVRFFAGLLAGEAAWIDITFDFPFRFIYFLSESNTIDLSVVAEQA